MFYKSSRQALTIWSLLLLFIGGLLWYGISSDYPEEQTKSPGYATLPAAQNEKQRNVEKANRADLAKTNPALASPFEASASEPGQSRITGRWVGAIEVAVGNRLQFSFNLREHNGQLSGTATFPIGEAAIEDGKINADQLSFTTRQWAPLTGQALLTQFSGRLSADGLELIMLSEGGESRLRLDPVSR